MARLEHFFYAYPAVSDYLRFPIFGITYQVKDIDLDRPPVLRGLDSVISAVDGGPNGEATNKRRLTRWNL
ncbi:MAG TPA: hypothetical protein DIU35_00480 [Candidatus Latescibacteria bacterium]|nr:hypothetical protein [Gemmatimonadota bacterium]HCR15933.1 hypothetical protein [Candidatus Latescibacterota bacterium]